MKDKIIKVIAYIITAGLIAVPVLVLGLIIKFLIGLF